MSKPNIRDILTSPRAQQELERMSAILESRNNQLHTTEQHLTYSERQLQKATKGYYQVLGAFVCLLLVLIAILVMGGAA